MGIESATGGFDWNQLFTIIGLASIISGGVSAIVNFFLTMKQEKKQRQVTVIQDELNLYSIVIYQLDRLLALGPLAFVKSPDGETQRQKIEQLKEVIQTIDSEIQKKFYLMSYDAITRWTSIKREYDVKDADNYTAEKIWNSKLNGKGLKDAILELRKTLVSQYNNVVIPEFRSIVGKELKRIP